uniref:Glycosyltransferase family 92 protein n=1 Tax=viral metagenome TaxID=1070528 RepID=A0A6C0HM13_9ZZZZ
MKTIFQIINNKLNNNLKYLLWFMCSIIIFIIFYIFYINKIEFMSNNNNNNNNNLILKNIQGFPLKDYKYLFFDIFYKDNNIYLILPIYNKPTNSDNIEVKINNYKLNKTNEYLKDIGEPTHILIYNYITDLEQFEVSITYENNTINYILQNNKLTKNKNENENKNDLVLTTLFKDDYILFPIFYKYYTQQGVSHFYMYYNGEINDNIKKMFNFKNVTLIQWNYQYFNNSDCKYLHHAQLGQMHHAIYKFGKNMCNYMIFCDIDEYLYIPDYTLKDFIMLNAEVDVFGFCNKWSNTIDNIIPKEFPNKFLTSKPIEYTDRSKNIYKISSINTINIHSGYDYPIIPKFKTDLYMFHFYNWSQSQRIKDDCNILTEIKL